MQGWVQIQVPQKFELKYNVNDLGMTVVVAHGGLMPDVPLEEQEEFVITRMRNLIPDGDGWIPSGQNRTNKMTHHAVTPGTTFKGARVPII